MTGSLVAAPTRPRRTPQLTGAHRVAAPERILFLGVVALLVVATAAILVAAMSGALGYDEAYNLQVPEHLAAHGRYATDGTLWGSAGRAYDSYISTGPSVLMPVAGLFCLLGTHLWVARLVPLAYYLLCLGLTWRVSRALASDGAARREGGQARWAPVMACAAVLAIDSTRWDPGDGVTAASVLGEYAAAALLLLAALRMPRRPWEAGIWFGVAVLTKFLMLLALPAFVVAAAIAAASTAKNSGARRRAVGTFLLGVVAPGVVWQAAKLLALGPHVYRARTIELVNFFATAGSGLDGGSSSEGLVDRMQIALSAWHVPAFLGVCLLIAILGLLHRRSYAHEERTAGSDARRVLCVALGGAAVAQVLWWFLLSDRGYPRHLLVALVLGVPLLVSCSWRMLARSPAPRTARSLLAGTLTVCLLLSLLLTVLGDLRSPRNRTTLADEQAVVRALREAHARYIGFTAWWQNPETVFLTGLPARSLDGGRGGYLVVSPLEARLDGGAARQALATCAPGTVTRISGYAVCPVRPGGPSGRTR